MAGDFFDVHRAARPVLRRSSAMSPVMALSLRSPPSGQVPAPGFLRQFRDPAQAFEELNEQLAAGDRHEEFISAAVVVFDTEAGTLRYASAGHPPFFLFQEDGVLPCVPPARC